MTTGASHVGPCFRHLSWQKLDAATGGFIAMRFALLISLVLSVAPLTRARANSIDVRAEIETRVGLHHVVLGNGCRFGVVPSIVITKPPVNGALRVQTEIVRIPDTDLDCAGQTARAAVIYYKSVVGYHGTDSFSYEQVPDSGQVIDVELNIK
jgi:hypothetical protein